MSKEYPSLQARLDEKARERRASSIENTVGAASVAAVLGLICVWGWWLGSRAETVVSTEPAGQVIGADYIASTMSDSTRVDTSKAVYLVYGAFQAVKGNTLTIELRRNGDRLLCDHATNACNKLVD